MKSLKGSGLKDGIHLQGFHFEFQVIECWVTEFGLAVAVAAVVVNPSSSTIGSTYLLSGFGYTNPRPPKNSVS